MGLFQRLAIVLSGSLCLVAMLAIWLLLTGSFDATGVRVLGSTAVISLCVVGGLVGVAVLDRPDLRRVLGAATALLATVVASLSLAAIWGVSFSEFEWRALAVCATLLTACGHACLMLGRLRASDGRAVRGLTGAAVALAMAGALLVAGGFAFATSTPGAWFWRLLGVLAVLSTLATLLAPIVRRLEQGRPGGSRAGGAEEPEPPVPAPAHARRPRHLWFASGV